MYLLNGCLLHKCRINILPSIPGTFIHNKSGKKRQIPCRAHHAGIPDSKAARLPQCKAVFGKADIQKDLFLQVFQKRLAGKLFNDTSQKKRSYTVIKIQRAGNLRGFKGIVCLHAAVKASPPLHSLTNITGHTQHIPNRAFFVKAVHIFISEFRKIVHDHIVHRNQTFCYRKAYRNGYKALGNRVHSM